MYKKWTYKNMGRYRPDYQIHTSFYLFIFWGMDERVVWRWVSLSVCVSKMILSVIFHPLFLQSKQSISYLPEHNQTRILADSIYYRDPNYDVKVKIYC